jgi:hypothetical protein
MRGKIYRYRKVRLSTLVLVLGVLSFSGSQTAHWAKRFAEHKVEEFTGNRFAVRIGDISGGFYRNMALQDVVFISGSGGADRVFRIERMEISYRVWDGLLEKIRIFTGQERPLEYIGIFFCDENPFVRGFVNIYSYPEKLEVLGHVSPVLFGEKRKRGLKGTLSKNNDGKYDCDLLWDGRIKIGGVLDPSEKTIDIGFNPVDARKGTAKIKAGIGEEEDLGVYLRVDKVDLAGTEVIGDFWMSYRDEDAPYFMLRADNLVVNKRPFWGFVAEGRFLAEKDAIALERVKWGNGFTLSGSIGAKDPYVSDLKLVFSEVDVGKISTMFGNTKFPISGLAEGDVAFTGPIKNANVKGRFFIGEGVAGNMEFRSISTELEGKLPVIKVVDSRVVKEGGYLIVNGEMDFSKLRENKVFEKVVFETDNKVAVWEEWQISKQEKDGQVEAAKDRVTVSTSLEDNGKQQGNNGKDPAQNELGMKYELDKSNSLKVEIDEKDDFLGLEHKIEF